MKNVLLLLVLCSCISVSAAHAQTPVPTCQNVLDNSDFAALLGQRVAGYIEGYMNGRFIALTTTSDKDSERQWNELQARFDKLDFTGAVGAEAVTDYCGRHRSVSVYEAMKTVATLFVIQAGFDKVN